MGSVIENISDKIKEEIEKATNSASSNSSSSSSSSNTSKVDNVSLIYRIIDSNGNVVKDYNDVLHKLNQRKYK